MSTTFLQLWLGAGLWMVLLWLWQWYRKDATIVDVGWAFGLAGTALFFGIAAPGYGTRRLLVAALAGGWALRLGIYLFGGRVLGHHGEDGRYQRMRRAMGRWAQLGFFLFFQAQALFIVLFALPIYAAAANPVPRLRWLDLLGLLVGVAAVVGELTADWQLSRFRADPANAGHTCQQGLWHYSRHPNYFFEIVHWFAYVLLASGSNWVWLACLGPVLMYVFIMKVTGVPHTEQQAASHRPDYDEYRRRTNMLIPWPPKTANSPDQG